MQDIKGVDFREI